MENKKKNKFGFLANLDVMVASIILAILIILTFAGVICRYVFKAPFTWLEEVQTSCMVWITFAAAGAAFRTGNHVAIEMIVDLMPKKVQKIMEIVIAVIVVIILGFLFVQTIPYLKIFLESSRSTSMLHIPYILIYGISLFSYVDMVISFIYSIIHGVKSEAKEAASGNE